MNIIRYSQKTEPACIFCDGYDRQDIGLTIDGTNICSYHLSVIKGTAPEKPPVSELIPRAVNVSNSHVSELDMLDRLYIPKRFITHLQLKKGDRLTALVHTTKKFAELFPAVGGNIPIGSFNMITLTPNMLSLLEWGERDCITVTLDTKHNLLRLTLQDKYVPECVFCGSSDIAYTLQGRDICELHVQKMRV